VLVSFDGSPDDVVVARPVMVAVYATIRAMSVDDCREVVADAGSPGGDELKQVTQQDRS
jgi:hypothetical protein